MIVYAASAIAFVGCLGVATALAMGKPVPAVLSVSPLGLVLLACWFTGASSMSAAYTAGLAAPAPLSLTVYGLTLSQGLLPIGWTHFLMVPSVLLLLLGCVVGSIRGQQKVYMPAAMAAVLVLLLVGGVARHYAAAVMFGMDMNVFYPVRMPVYLALGLLAALAMLRGDPEQSGPESAATAGLAFLLFVAGFEVAGAGYNHALVYDAVGASSLEMKGVLQAAGTAVVWTELGRGYITVVWASCIALVGIGVGASAAEDRGYGALLGLLWVLVAACTLGGTDPMPGYLKMDAQLFAAQWPAPSDDLRPAVSSARKPPQHAVAVQITRKTVMVNGEVIDELGRAANPKTGKQMIVPTNRGGLIPPLASALADQKARWKTLSPVITRAEEFDPTLLIVADKATPYNVMEMVLATGPVAGYDRPRIGVQGRYKRAVVDISYAAKPAAAPASEAMAFLPVVAITEAGYTVHAEGQILELPCSKAGCPSVDTYDSKELAKLINQLKDRYPDTEKVTLVPHSDAAWEVVVSALDATRDEPENRSSRDGRVLFPDATLGGPDWIPAPPPVVEDPLAEDLEPGQP